METATIKRYIGIDLGTTNSSICYTSFNAGKNQFDDPKLVLFGDSKTLRSVLLLDQDGVGVVTSGEDVFSHPDYLCHPERVHYEFKLAFGTESLASHCTHLLAGELMSGLLGNLALPNLTPEENTMTVGVPANWAKNDLKRVELVCQAVEQAGFPNLQAVPEPVAAMHYHAFLGDILYRDKSQYWLVIDMGGGTTDLALVQTQPGGKQPEIQNTFGHNYGGKDFDRQLYEKFLIPRCWTGAPPTPAQKIELMRFVKEFKEEFSDQVMKGKTSHRKTYRRLQQLSPVELTYDEFESDELLGPLVNRFVAYILQKAFKELDINFSRIDHVILTGGSARWKFVRDALEIYFDSSAVIMSKNPELTIAKGLALARTGFAPPIQVQVAESVTMIESDPVAIPAAPFAGAAAVTNGKIDSKEDILKHINSLQTQLLESFTLIEEPSRPFTLSREQAQDKAKRTLHTYAAAGGFGAILTAQVPGIASASLPALEAKMVYDIARVFGYLLDQKQMTSAFGGILAGGLLAKLVAMELSGMVPGVGNLIKGTVAAAFIEGLGIGAIQFVDSRRFGSHQPDNLLLDGG